jgi:hypothetical protein
LVDGVVYYDMGCGIIGAELPMSDMMSLIEEISGSTDTFAVGNAVENTIYQSGMDEEATAENKETIKDGFFQRIIKMVQQILAQLMTSSPQVRALQAIISGFESPDGITTKIGNPVQDMKQFKIFLKCMINDLMKMINQFIFELIVSFLIAMLVPIVKRIIQEKINQYVGILKSLIS